MRTFIFLSLFLLLSLEASAMSGFCFREDVTLLQVERSLGAILHPSDQVVKNASTHCIEIQGSNKRTNLYEIFLNKQFRVERSYGTEQKDLIESGVPPCNINVRRTGSNTNTINSFSIGRKNNLRKNESSSQRITNSQLLIDSGRSGSIQVDQYRIKVTCINLIRRFKLDIELEHMNGGVNTSVTVVPGQELDLGSIVDDINNKNKSLSLSKGIKKSHTLGKVQSKYSITVK
jgi:hypothetical protein